MQLLKYTFVFIFTLGLWFNLNIINTQLNLLEYISQTFHLAIKKIL